MLCLVFLSSSPLFSLSAILSPSRSISWCIKQALVMGISQFILSPLDLLEELQQACFSEAWQTNGIWMMATSYVTQHWYCPTYKRSTPLTLKWGQNETKRKQKSSTTSQTWTQLLLSGKSTTFDISLCTTAVHENVTLGLAVGPRQCVTDQLLAKAEVIGAMHERILHDGQAATVFDEVGRRSLERLFPGFSEDSSQPQRRQWMLPAQHTWQTAHSRHDSGRSNSWPPASTTSLNTSGHFS